MDPVQELLESVGEAQVNGSSRATPPATTSAPARRTKVVFVYSDEDGGEDDCHRSDETAAERRGIAEVPCEGHAIALSEDALAELRADAHAIDAHLNDSSADACVHNADEIDVLSFHEDVLGGLGAAASATGLTSVPVSKLLSASSGGMRVREVHAPSLWDGAVASSSSGAHNHSREGNDAANVSAETEMPALLRRGLPAATFVLESRRKRFRDVEGKAEVRKAASSPTAPSAAVLGPLATPAAGAPPAAPPPSTTEANGEEEEEEEVAVEELELQPVYDEDGTMVRALKTRGGYQLTLDERDLLETVVDGEGADAATEDHVEADVDGAEEQTPVVGGNDDDGCLWQHGVSAGEVAAVVDHGAEEENLGDFFDNDYDDDDDDGEEEEIDEAIVVAVVEQLVRCCEADDLDPQMSLEAARFTAAAKPLLTQLTGEAITAKEFGQRIDRDLRRFQRIYRSVYRPRDSPIVIDGVVMDM
jgi:hypothetical protein